MSKTQRNTGRWRIKRKALSRFQMLSTAIIVVASIFVTTSVLTDGSNMMAETVDVFVVEGAKQDIETEPATPESLSLSRRPGAKHQALRNASRKSSATSPAVPPTEPEAAETPDEAESGIPEYISLGEYTLSAYCACSRCCGEWADGYTYTQTLATQGRTVAVDPNKIPLGSKLLINGREYIAEDIGGAIKNKKIDMFFNSHEDALQFEIQHAEVLLCAEEIQ